MAACIVSKTLKSQRTLAATTGITSTTSTLRSSAFTFSTTGTSLPPPPHTPLPPVSETLENGRGRLSRWLLFLPGAITFGLGTWQIFRRQEKIEMLEYRRKRLEMEPILWNKITSSDVDLDSLEFKKVICEGFFDESKSIYVGPRSRSISGVTENGYYIVTPLIPVTNHPESVQMAVLVNRGWVPRRWRDESFHLHDGEKSSSITPPHIEEVEEWNPWWKFWSKKSESIKPEEPPSTPIKVVGVVRGNEKPSIFVPANDPSSGQWFYVDISAMARACGLPENTIYVEDINDSASASNPYPVSKDVNTLIRFSVMPQDHLNYTMTWYSLSAAVTYMAMKRLKPKKIRR
ncbi:Surfeit locus protein 1 [Acorus gramineus]|uniref:SURF1-like protein n=1 Tax=Acorus gramineus TaxID=55184 RepID=A0AAV9BF32_ACOGR|nr:Surfeit locus protein 1 [Acorus gramineus]